jgi:hypothetical protein
MEPEAPPNSARKMGYAVYLIPPIKKLLKGEISLNGFLTLESEKIIVSP